MPEIPNIEYLFGQIPLPPVGLCANHECIREIGITELEPVVRGENIDFNCPYCKKVAVMLMPWAQSVGGYHVGPWAVRPLADFVHENPSGQESVRLSP